MKNGKIESIVIVGGGSSGWMSAAYLSRALPDIKITLVESSDVPTIGVGEATIATLSGYLSAFDLKEEDWMPFCNATYKYAIRFKNWHQIGDNYWHPFESLPYYGQKYHLGHFWYLRYLQARGKKERESLYKDCFLSVDFAKKNKILRSPDSPQYVDQCTATVDKDAVPLAITYAYHFDAGLFGEYLKQNLAKPAGVVQIIDHVTNVNQDENGFIKSIDTKTGRNIEGDLFIDCSGFRSILLDKTLSEPFQPYAESLYCDKAIAMRVPYQNISDEMEPYTSATALTAGWVWNIPLTSRIGSGYVYCSAYKDADDAEKEYRQYLGEERVKDLNCAHINIRVGRHERSWVKNCVAIGLASGFIEPLESTGLHFVFAATVKLAEALSARVFNASVIAGYNSYIAKVIDEARDFVTIHYALTAREDSAFWKDVKYNAKIGEPLAGLLEKYKNGFPNKFNRAEYKIFSEHSWVCILNGMNYLPGFYSYVELQKIPDIEKQYRLMDEIQNVKKQLEASTAVNHYEYLAKRDNLNTE